MSDSQVTVISTVKRITTGRVPTPETLPIGHIAFGRITSDGKYHIYGNVGGGTIVDLTPNVGEMSVGDYQTGTSQTPMMISPATLKLILEDFAVNFDGINSEIQGELDNKSSVNHTHTVSNITDFPDVVLQSDLADWVKSADKPVYSKSDIGLEHVDNTRDLDKPIPTSVQIELNRLQSEINLINSRL